MGEADRVARAPGRGLAVGVDQRLAGAKKVGDHKASMLQDVESGRPPARGMPGAPPHDVLDFPDFRPYNWGPI